MQAREVKKLYYSIGEISQKTGLKQYVLRYWETEFSHIKPSKNRAGNRVYKESDYHNIEELNVGGGLGIRYTESDDPPSIDEWVKTISSSVVEAKI